uniref:Uncharacterized protein n=1 Tax=Plectus sambesii TaxID=2011161 RepID=A0A914VVZ5_9BILA
MAAGRRMRKHLKVACAIRNRVDRKLSATGRARFCSIVGRLAHLSACGTRSPEKSFFALVRCPSSFLLGRLHQRAKPRTILSIRQRPTANAAVVVADYRSSENDPLHVNMLRHGGTRCKRG